MSEYLVHMQIRMPPTMPRGPGTEHDRLYEAEHQHCKGPEITQVLRRLWREAGTTNNYGLWEAEDVSELHEAIAGLPLFPYMRVPLIVPLARLVNDPGPHEAWRRAGAEVYRLPTASSRTPFVPDIIRS